MIYIRSLPVLALGLSLFASGVAAHGYVQSVVVAGKSYPGWAPFTDPYAQPVPERIVRKLQDDGPVLDVHDPNLACNVGGNQGTKLVADAPAGSDVVFNWTKWPADHLGPVSCYMASCNGDCSTFDATGAKWFKVDAAGYQNGQWASMQITTDGKWTCTIPAALAAGQYLIRHEIIALHNAGQPQFYPSCTQLKVTGGGGQLPSGSELVSIPGLYDNTKFPDIWSNFGTFNIPGPAQFPSGGSNAQAQPSPTHAPGSSSSSPSDTRPVTSAPQTQASVSSAPVSMSSPSSTGRCRSRTAKRMSKRHVSHAKRHH